MLFQHRRKEAAQVEVLADHSAFPGGVQCGDGAIDQPLTHSRYTHGGTAGTLQERALLCQGPDEARPQSGNSDDECGPKEFATRVSSD